MNIGFVYDSYNNYLKKDIEMDDLKISLKFYKDVKQGHCLIISIPEFNYDYFILEYIDYTGKNNPTNVLYCLYDFLKNEENLQNKILQIIKLVKKCQLLNIYNENKIFIDDIFIDDKNKRKILYIYKNLIYYQLSNFIENLKFKDLSFKNCQDLIEYLKNEIIIFEKKIIDKKTFTEFVEDIKNK